jgi:cold shock protein
MKKGTVKFFNTARGFGFIKAESGEDVFMHVTELRDDVRENDQVVFDVAEGKRGIAAVNIKLA